MHSGPEQAVKTTAHEGGVGRVTYGRGHVVQGEKSARIVGDEGKMLPTQACRQSGGGVTGKKFGLLLAGYCWWATDNTDAELRRKEAHLVTVVYVSRIAAYYRGCKRKRLQRPWCIT